MKAVSIYPDPKFHADFKKALEQRDDIHLCRSFDTYPDGDTLARVLRAWAPSIVFLDIRHPATEPINVALAAEFPEIRRIAIHPAQVPEIFRRVLDLGMRELVSPPFKPQVIGPVLDRVVADIMRNPIERKQSGRVTAFLPAKAGAGASTLAAHATWAVAEDAEERVLLVDLDRHSGITAFQFDRQAEYTLQDALLRSLEMDEDYWRNLVQSVKNVDLLLSRPGEIVETANERFVEPLIRFAQRNYTAVHLDLPDALDGHSLAALYQADQIFIVSTPELASLRLAKLKLETLKKVDLGGRTMLLLNRVGPRMGLNIQDIQDAVGADVFASFPSEYSSVSRSLCDAKPSPKLMPSVRDFLDKCREIKKAPRKPSFIERISINFSGNMVGTRRQEPIRVPLLKF